MSQIFFLAILLATYFSLCKIQTAESHMVSWPSSHCLSTSSYSLTFSAKVLNTDIYYTAMDNMYRSSEIMKICILRFLFTLAMKWFSVNQSGKLKTFVTIKQTYNYLSVLNVLSAPWTSHRKRKKSCSINSCNRSETEHYITHSNR